MFKKREKKNEKASKKEEKLQEREESSEKLGTFVEKCRKGEKNMRV